MLYFEFGTLPSVVIRNNCLGRRCTDVNTGMHAYVSKTFTGFSALSASLWWQDKV